ncbi:MAG: hypothetical protein LBS32_08405 [Clostridiales Family XIII bacterium]|jgi:putative membrane fusion protein|nr:hypothetical protein [Clostridiales Family XIII bacterium]
MGKSKRIAFAAFAVAVAALYVVAFVVPDVAGALKETVVLEYGRLAVSDTVTGFVVRDETVYLADRAGGIRYYVGEGTKVRRNARLLDIVPELLPVRTGEGQAQPPEGDEARPYAALAERIGDRGVTLDVNAAERGGVVSYYVDGYEGLFSPENMGSLTWEAAEAAAGKTENLTRHEGMVAERGEPIYKIVDDTLWHMVFWLESGSKSIVNYIAGEAVTVSMESGEVQGAIRDVLNQGDRWMVSMTFDRHYENLAQLRSVEAEVVVSDYRGLIVENGSIASEGGQAGLYVKGKSGDFAFVPVNVLRSDGERSIISAASFIRDGEEIRTVNIYEEVLREPEL